MSPSRTIPVSFAVTLIASIASANDVKNDPRVQIALNLLEVWAEAEMAYADIPAVSMAVVHDQELLWSRAFGFADRERKAAASTDTLYSICSISKLFTAIAVLQARDAGRLRLDDPVSQHLPWFKIAPTDGESGPVTIEGVLTHASGLPRESDYPYWTGPSYAFPTRDQIIERIDDS